MTREKLAALLAKAFNDGADYDRAQLLTEFLPCKGAQDYAAALIARLDPRDIDEG